MTNFHSNVLKIIAFELRIDIIYIKTVPNQNEDGVIESSD